LLSFGANLPGYSLLYRAVPLLDAIRAPVRFGQFTLVAIAGLAGFGAAWWLSRLQGRRTRTIAGAVLIALVNLEALRAPIQYVVNPGEPVVLKHLSVQPDAVVAYFPFHAQPGAIGGNTHYMLWSTRNWRPMLNGYSGLIPQSFYRHAECVRMFPLPESIDYLRRVGVTHVVVDAARLSEPRLARLPQARGLTLWAADGAVRIYRLEGQVAR
jgi:hypothetical protein